MQCDCFGKMQHSHETCAITTATSDEYKKKICRWFYSNCHIQKPT